ncbi:MAG: RNA-directed DNA polymerase [Candidatus Fibromonas sp.]|nr:RNA-directed DNA polymerase [Candidatus Fibromonas sp.]
MEPLAGLQKASAYVSALPGGNGNSDGSFNNVGNNGNWWSASENNSNNAYNRNMNYNNDNANWNNNNKNNLFSVRCVQDCKGETGQPASPIFLELHKAYLDARKHKRNTINQLKFERNLEVELLSLCNELETRTYELRPGICFINELPVKREIIAADFRDRVIHHFLYNRIYPALDRKFIYDSYSCRVGKGTSFGIERVQKFLKSCTTGALHWVLRLDIQGFFMAINRSILFDLIISGLHGEICDLSEFLIRKIVFNDPLKNSLFKSPKSAWNNLPPDKSLIYSAPDCGLPIGNLTSQIFANVYLNPLDHFVKRDLKIKYYGRYVDDRVLIHNDKQVLLNAIFRIREFLQGELKLTLHPKKIRLQTADKGFAFLGAYVYPDGVALGRRIVKNFRGCVFNPFADPEKQAQRVQSYLGLFRG